MAREKRPAFPFYPKDWLSSASVSAMPLAAQGLYVRLMAFAWQSDGLPCSDESLRNLVGVSRAEWRKLWPLVSPMWREENGRLFNGKLEHIREESLAFSASAGVAGRASAAAKAQRKVNGTVNGTATKLPTESQPASASASASTEKTHTLTPAAAPVTAPTPTSAAADGGVDWGASPSRKVSPNNAYTSRRAGLSVPQFLHAELLSRMAVPDEPALFAWYTATERAYDGRAIGETALKFWRARFEEEYGATSQARVAGLRGGGKAPAGSRGATTTVVLDAGINYRFSCHHGPPCASWAECRGKLNAEAS